MIGSHSQTMPIAAPAIIEALGTRPMRRIAGDVAVSVVIGSATRSLTAAIPPTYGAPRRDNTPFTAIIGALGTRSMPRIAGGVAVSAVIGSAT